MRSQKLGDRKVSAALVLLCLMFASIILHVISIFKFKSISLHLEDTKLNDKYTFNKQQLVETENQQLAYTDKQLLVFHVGPEKMATTSIQHEIHTQVENLSLDNWITYSFIDARDLNYCLRMDMVKCQNGSKEWVKFNDFLTQAKENKMNVLISTERYWKISSIDVYKFLFRSFEVKIVVGYRRLYEYVPSVYGQYYKFGCAKKIPHDPPLYIETSSLIPSLSYFSLSWMNNLNHPTLAKLTQFKPSFDNIEVLNIHSSCVVCIFFCNVVQNAHKTCEAVRLKYLKENIHNKNVGKPIWVSRLAQQLLKASGGHDKPSKRLECHALTREITQYMNKELNWSLFDLPKTCMPKNILNKFLNNSLGTEEMLLPRFFSSDEGEEVHRIEFELASNNMLCDVDVSAIRDDKNWENFFKAHPKIKWAEPT